MPRRSPGRTQLKLSFAAASSLDAALLSTAPARKWMALAECVHRGHSWREHPRLFGSGVAQPAQPVQQTAALPGVPNGLRAAASARARAPPGSLLLLPPCRGAGTSAAACATCASSWTMPRWTRGGPASASGERAPRGERPWDGPRAGPTGPGLSHPRRRASPSPREPQAVVRVEPCDHGRGEPTFHVHAPGLRLCRALAADLLQ